MGKKGQKEGNGNQWSRRERQKNVGDNSLSEENAYCDSAIFLWQHSAQKEAKGWKRNWVLVSGLRPMNNPHVSFLISHFPSPFPSLHSLFHLRLIRIPFLAHLSQCVPFCLWQFGHVTLFMFPLGQAELTTSNPKWSDLREDRGTFQHHSYFSLNSELLVELLWMMQDGRSPTSFRFFSCIHLVKSPKKAFGKGKQNLEGD